MGTKERRSKKKGEKKKKKGKKEKKRKRQGKREGKKKGKNKEKESLATHCADVGGDMRPSVHKRVVALSTQASFLS